MANLWNKIREMARQGDAEADEEPEEEKKSYADRRSIDVRPSYHTDRPARPEFRDVDPKDKVISMNKALHAITSRVDLDIKYPRSFEEGSQLVDSVKARKAVIINLEHMETDAAWRLFNFMLGAIYALNGKMGKVANNIFVFVHEGGNVSSPPEHSGIDFSGTESGVKSPWSKT
jgi:cell division inhibitor SepF